MCVDICRYRGHFVYSKNAEIEDREVRNMCVRVINKTVTDAQVS